MCLKEVDLNVNRICQSDELLDVEEEEPNQIPSLSSGSLPSKDGWERRYINRAITEKERRDSQLLNCVNGSAVFHVQGAWIRDHLQEIQKTNLSSAVRKLWWILASVNKWILRQLCVTRVLSSTVLKLLWSLDTVVKLLIIFLLLCGTGCRADGTGDTSLREVLFPAMHLNCKVPPNSHAKWLRGHAAIVENVDENQNLIISNQDMKNYVCEIWLPNGDRVVYHFPMPAFSSCAIVENSQDIAAFERGKKCIQVELEGKAGGSDPGKVSQQYIISIQNRTMEISPEEGSGLLLLTTTKCNIKFKEIKKHPDTNAITAQVSEKNMTSVEEGVDEKSKKVVDSFLVAGVVAGVIAGVIFICLGTWCCIKRCRRKVAQVTDEEAAAEPAIDKERDRNSSTDLLNQERTSCILDV